MKNIGQTKLTFEIACCYNKISERAYNGEESDDFDDSHNSSESDIVDYNELPQSEKIKVLEYINFEFEIFKDYIKNHHQNNKDIFRSIMKKQWNYTINNDIILFELVVENKLADEVLKGFDMECTDGHFSSDGDMDYGPLGPYNINLFGRLYSREN